MVFDSRFRLQARICQLCPQFHVAEICSWRNFSSRREEIHSGSRASSHPAPIYVLSLVAASEIHFPTRLSPRMMVSEVDGPLAVGRRAAPFSSARGPVPHRSLHFAGAGPLAAAHCCGAHCRLTGGGCISKLQWSLAVQSPVLRWHCPPASGVSSTDRYRAMPLTRVVLSIVNVPAANQLSRHLMISNHLSIQLSSKRVCGRRTHGHG